MTTFDRRCALLAASFLDEEPALSHANRLVLEPKLAQHIQNAIEQWLEYEVTVIRMSARKETPMLLSLLLTVVILGVLAWGVSAIPMPAPFKTVAYVILVVILVLIVAQVAGVVPLGVTR